MQNIINNEIISALEDIIRDNDLDIYQGVALVEVIKTLKSFSDCTTKGDIVMRLFGDDNVLFRYEEDSDKPLNYIKFSKSWWNSMLKESDKSEVDN